MKSILPQHIPGGEHFTPADLEEINREREKVPARLICYILLMVLVYVLLPKLLPAIIGGFVGNILMAVIFIFTPLLVALAMRSTSKKYRQAIEKAGLSAEQATDAVRNCAQGVAAWGTLPSSEQKKKKELTEEEILRRKKRRKTILIFVGAAAVLSAVGLVWFNTYHSYDHYRTTFEITREDGKNQKEDYGEIISVLNDRFNILRELADHTARSPKYSIKNGILVLKNRSFLLSNYNKSHFWLFFSRGEITITDYDTGELLFTDADYTVDCTREEGRMRQLILTLTDDAYDRLCAVETIRLLVDGERISNQIFDVSSLIEESPDHSLIFPGDIPGDFIYIAHCYSLPVDIEVNQVDD